MKRLFLFGAITTLLVTMVSISWATSNLNLSKSNINRVADPVAAACQGKKLGDVVKVGGKEVKCEQRHIAVSDSAPQPPKPPIAIK